MKISEARLERTTSMFKDYAREQVRVEFIGSYLYVFGSELACLRIFHRYCNSEEARVERSVNLGTWFYSHKTHEEFEMP